MTQPQTNPDNPTNPTDPDNLNDASADLQADPQTVAFEQTSVTDPATGDTVTETIATEDVADATVTEAISDASSSAATAFDMAPDGAQATFGNPSAYGAPTTTDTPTSATTDTSTAAYAQTSAQTVDSMGNPYTAAPTSSPYGQPSTDAFTDHTMPADAYSTPTYAASGYAAPGSAQQPAYGAPNGAQPAYAAPTTYYVARNKILAGLLALFFGMFGIHNFYLGYTGRGIAQLLLTVLGWIVLGLGPLAALIWSWIEGVRILTSDYGTPEHRDARGVELMD
ncbi:TM2 domain-containing protein [Bifidobacterium italicum]|uniref:TM2 domain-containing protein n=1 Tax=Bifidobacterium italicum TaxID=1960968 RepID=A0A2A2EMG4_9BIFI|nr:TM2 domain-containing protein [Bifidobacterium italicum]PAU70221.1 TM2 domain-containing protein [Bifidobacterium italicum]